MFKKKQQGEAEAQQAARSPGKGFKPFLKRNWKRIAAGAVVLVVAGAFLMPRQASPASTSVSYLQDTPQRRSITNVFSDSGTITAANTYEVKPLVRGTVLTADFQEGDMVQAGDVLYTIDSSDAANSVARAQLSLNQAQRSYEDAVNAQYVRTDIGGTVVSIGVAPGDVVTAGQEVATIRDESVMLLTLDFPAADAAGFAVGQTAEVTLDGTYERIAGTIRSVSGADTLSSGSLLVRSVTIAVPNNGSLTAAQAATASVNGVSALGSARLAYQKSQTLAAASAGTVAALCVQPGSAVGAGANVIQLASDSLTRQVETASDNLLSAELSVDDAENTMDNYTITAPISGTIIQKNVQAGETVGGDSTTAATAMCIIHDLSYLEMTLNVDELQILSMQVGQNVQIKADAIPDQTFNGGGDQRVLGGHHHQRHHHLPGHHPDRRLRPIAARDERHRRDRGGQRPGRPLHPQCRRDPRQLCAGDRRLPQRSQRRDGYDRPRGLCLCPGPDRHQRRRLHPGAGRSGGGRHRGLRRFERQLERLWGHGDAGHRFGRLRMSALIEFDDVCKYYQMGDTTVKAADHISMQIQKGEFVAIVGQSGSGKSTCMNIIGCLDVPTSGVYRLNGRDVGSMDKNELAEIRNEMLGFIFQQYNLLPKLTLLENVELPLVYAGLSRSEQRQRAAEALEQVGLGNKLNNRPSQLSGGQQQRASIARALVGRPAVILADEPTGALDSHTGREVLGILQKLHRQGNTVVLITHDNSIAMQAPRIIRLEDGRVVYDGDAHSPEAVVHPNYASEEAEGQEEQQQEGSV